MSRYCFLSIRSTLTFSESGHHSQSLHPINISLSEFQHHKMATPAPIPVNNLRRAAGEIIAHLQGIPQFAKEKVAVVGGMAVMEYIPDRTTKVCLIYAP
jgi:hypothetical protein